MSSYDGGGFDEWLRDSIFQPVSDETWKQLVAILEPWRDSIDYYCDEYDPETQSWRDYRNSLWYGIPDDVNARVNELLKQDISEQLASYAEPAKGTPYR